MTRSDGTKIKGGPIHHGNFRAIRIRSTLLHEGNEPVRLRLRDDRTSLELSISNVRYRFRRARDHRILALVFIGPKDLPKVMRTVGYWVGRVRGMARHFHRRNRGHGARSRARGNGEAAGARKMSASCSVHPDSSPDPHTDEIDTMPPVAELAEPGLPFEEKQPVDELPLDKRPLP